MVVVESEEEPRDPNDRVGTVAGIAVIVIILTAFFTTFGRCLLSTAC